MEIASLIVRLGADMSDLLTESKKANAALEGMANSVKQLGVAMGITFSVSAIVAGVNAVLQFAGAMKDMSAATGIGVEQLQELSYAGKLVGVSLEQITGGIAQMQNRLASGDKSALGALKEMKITLGELDSMTPDEQFKRIAKGIQAIEDPAKRVQVAMDLFGKAGAQMLPLLTSNMDEAARAARELGLVMDQDTVNAFDDLGDKIDTLKTAGLMVFANLLKELLPMLTDLAQVLLDVSAAARDLFGWFNQLDRSLDTAANGIRQWFGLAPIDYQGIRDAKKSVEEATTAQQGLAGANRETAGTFQQAAKAADEHNVVLERMKKVAAEVAQHQKAIADTREQLIGRDLIERAREYVAALAKIPEGTHLVTDVSQKAAEEVKRALDVMKQTGKAATAEFTAATEAYRRLQGLTKEGLLPSKRYDTGTGLATPTPDAADDLLKVTNNLTTSVRTLRGEVDTLGDGWGELGVDYQQTSAILIDGKGAMDGASDATNRNAAAMRNMTGATQQGIATLTEWMRAIEAAGNFENELSGIDWQGAPGGGMTGSGVGGRFKPRGFATGTNGYEYFGTGTPAMLHGWEKVTPRGAGGADSVNAITVNMSGMLLTTNPSAREELGRFINDSIAASIKRSRKFSY